jgi:hypothetical protein
MMEQPIDVLIYEGYLFFLRCLKRIWPFGRKKFTEERWQVHYEAKKNSLERILKKMDDVVGHAIIPFAIGGALDMYYFSNLIPGTVFASMELINPDGKGPKPNRLGTYEVITCTRKTYTSIPKETHKQRIARIENGGATEFEKVERQMCSIMTRIGYYSMTAVLQPKDTAELPNKEGEPYDCIFFDEFDTKEIPFEVEGRRHGLLLCVQVHPTELQYAREHGTDKLIEKLMDAGIYPYSDLDREPVV